MSKLKDKRRNDIQKILLEENQVKVDVLAKKFSVSPETIRTDLTFLEDKGFIYRNHGGAYLRSNTADAPMDVRTKENVEEKKAISEAAFDFIDDDMLIFISPSSTAVYLAKLLVLKKNLTIFTNSIDILMALIASHHDIYLIGGEYNRNGKRFIGEYSDNMVKNICFDLCLMGMDGCKGIDGPANKTRDEDVMNQIIMKKCHKNILLSDNTKFEQFANYQYADFDQFDVLITNKLDNTDRERLKGKIDIIKEV